MGGSQDVRTLVSQPPGLLQVSVPQGWRRDGEGEPVKPEHVFLTKSIDS